MKTIQLPTRNINSRKPELVYKDKLLIHTNSGTFLIRKSDIIFLKAESNYCEIYLEENVILCSKTLKHFYEKLSSIQFIRTHNSYLVNIQHITFIDSAYQQLEIMGKWNIPVARRRSNELKRRLEVLCD
ncbi:MAG: LytTR family DNA-binding domain-containing protein [Bacteroidota bacterium]